MRHSAATFAEQIKRRAAAGQKWDLIFCSDMLNLAEFLGLAHRAIKDLPAVAYFHENQLTYPKRFEHERDYQFAMTNMTTAISADSVWFNSAFHRNSFLDALQGLLRKMPDYQPMDAVEKIAEKARVYPPGITDIIRRNNRKPGPARMLWAARWEHDKAPEDFFEALDILKSRAINFRVSVIGQQFREVPRVFESARKRFAEHIDRWGYQKNRAEYEQALAEADLMVSTAGHEFFGISIVEAIAAGAYPVLPKRLAYPEVLGLGQAQEREKFFYDGSVKDLVNKLEILAGQIEKGHLQQEQYQAAQLVERFKWHNLAPVLDKAAEKTVRTAQAANTTDL